MTKRFAKEKLESSDLWKRFKENTGLTANEAEWAWKQAMGVLNEAICDRDVKEIKLYDIGKIRVSDVRQFKYQDLQTGEMKLSDPTIRLVFKQNLVSKDRMKAARIKGGR